LLLELFELSLLSSLIAVDEHIAGVPLHFEKPDPSVTLRTGIKRFPYLGTGSTMGGW